MTGRFLEVVNFKLFLCSRYILTSDLGLRTECCFLSGYFFKALFRSSLPHPSADRDYALYEVGEGCEVTNLVPGVDLMSERFRCDGRTLVAALRFIMDELGRGKHGLFVSHKMLFHRKNLAIHLISRATIATSDHLFFAISGVATSNLVPVLYNFCMPRFTTKCRWTDTKGSGSHRHGALLRGSDCLAGKDAV